MIFKRFNTNCNCRFLKLKMEIKAKVMEPKIKPKIKGSFLCIATIPSLVSMIGNQ